jgi:hypothetical protein
MASKTKSKGKSNSRVVPTMHPDAAGVDIGFVAVPAERDADPCDHSLVAVGTTIADRPPHRSVRARLRIRLLPWINGGN